MALAAALISLVACNRQTNASTIDNNSQQQTTTDANIAPEINMTTPDGKIVSLSDYRGKIVYIDIWATWCPPCRAELPHMKSLFEHFKRNDKVAILSISVDQDKEAWKKKITDEQMEWQQFICEETQAEELSKNYNLRSIPRFLIIDSEGKLVDADAIRPSSGKVEELIESLIAK